MDLPVARILRVRSGRGARFRARGHADCEAVDFDLQDIALARQVTAGGRIPPREFASWVLRKAGLTNAEGEGPVVVLAAGLACDPGSDSDTNLRDVLARVVREFGTGVAWAEGKRETTMGPLGRDLRDLHDVGGIPAALAVAASRMAAFAEAYERPEER